MGECRLNHSLQDVSSKLEEQKAYLPSDIVLQLQACLQQPLEQEILNQLFHLLKKYDLAEDAVRLERDAQFKTLLQGLTS
ncbi:group-specific protein [Brevibacillus fluminis]|uniref:Group-specific protein n=1 Tax=Brevibacillus fluminis TaxID=511487 RepID=A0A3M8D8J2_9BACL|nr:group-specific protein [Brevibacillus fluminis]RNB84440.1 group-specific protein [Brevibacillus fluminis]